MYVLFLMVLIMPFEQNPYLRIAGDFTMIKLLGFFACLWAFVLIAGGQVPNRVLSSRQTRAFGVYVMAILVAAMVRGAEPVPVQRLINVVALLPAVVAIVRREEDIRMLFKASAITLVALFPYAYRQAMRYGGRLGVGLYEPNYFALIMVLLVPITFVLARQERVAWKRYGLYFVMCFLAFESVLTGSRGGLLALAVATVVGMMRLVKRRGLAVLVILLMGVALLFSPTSIGKRLRAGWIENDKTGTAEEVNAVASAEVSNEDRRELLWAGLRMVRANPIVGVGLGRFKDFSMDYGAMLPHIAHNTYLELAGESGLTALFAYLFFLYTVFSSLKRAGKLAAEKGLSRLTDLTLAIRSSLLGYCIAAIFLSAEFEKFFWLTIFLSFALVDVIVTKAESAEPAAVTATVRGPALNIGEGGLWKAIGR